MDTIVEYMHKGGPLMYAVLLFTMGSAMAPLLWAGLTVARKRVPSPAWLLFPLITLVFGLLGRLLGQLQVSRAIGAASPDYMQDLLYSGLSIGLITEISAWGAAMVLFAGTAFVAGTCHAIGAGTGARWSVAPGLLAGALLLPGVIGLGVWVLAAGLPMIVLWIPTGLLMAGLGVVAAGLRDGAEDKDKERMAAGRALVGFSALLAVVSGWMFVYMSGTMSLFKAVGHRTSDTAMVAVTRGLELHDASAVGLVAVALIGLCALIPVLWSIRSLFKVPTFAWGTVSVLLVAVVVLLHGVAVWQSKIVATDGNLMAVTQVTLHHSELPVRNQPVDRMMPYFGQIAEVSTGAWMTFDTSQGKIDPYWGSNDVDPALVAVAADPSLTASELLDVPVTSRPGAARPELLVLTREPAGDLPGRWLDSPYHEWTRLSTVTFQWLPKAPADSQAGDGGPVATTPEPEVTAASEKAGLAALLADSGTIGNLLNEGSAAQAPLPIDLNYTLYVVDGAANGGEALGLDEATDATWLLSSQHTARSWDNLEDLAAALRGTIEESSPRRVAFVPGEHWTVQELITLCLTAAPQIEVYSSWDTPEDLVVCALDSQVPEDTLDAYGDEARLLGTAAAEEARAAKIEAIVRQSGRPPGGVIGMGSMDKDDIEKVIRRRLGAIKMCYERELAVSPSLAGKVSVSFTIDAQGRVSAASIKSTTLNNPKVENCILRTFKRMRFPAPVGGGIVNVTYPFVFKSA